MDTLGLLLNLNFHHLGLTGPPSLWRTFWVAFCFFFAAVNIQENMWQTEECNLIDDSSWQIQNILQNIRYFDLILFSKGEILVEEKCAPSVSKKKKIEQVVRLNITCLILLTQMMILPFLSLTLVSGRCLRKEETGQLHSNSFSGPSCADASSF